MQINKLDVLAVYPQKKKLYFGKKWAVVSYELSNGTRGIIDFPIQAQFSNVEQAAREEIKKAIQRGTYKEPEKYVPATIAA